MPKYKTTIARCGGCIHSFPSEEELYLLCEIPLPFWASRANQLGKGLVGADCDGARHCKGFLSCEDEEEDDE